MSRSPKEHTLVKTCGCQVSLLSMLQENFRVSEDPWLQSCCTSHEKTKTTSISVSHYLRLPSNININHYHILISMISYWSFVPQQKLQAANLSSLISPNPACLIDRMAKIQSHHGPNSLLSAARCCSAVDLQNAIAKVPLFQFQAASKSLANHSQSMWIDRQVSKLMEKCHEPGRVW